MHLGLIADCTFSLLRLNALDPASFHRLMADNLRLNHYLPLADNPDQLASTLYRPTGEFDLEVTVISDSSGNYRVNVCFDGFGVASCEFCDPKTVPTLAENGSPGILGKTRVWSIDHDESALWALGEGIAQEDVAGVYRAIEAAALVGWEHLADLQQAMLSLRD
jgi:hypothetical protein